MHALDLEIFTVTSSGQSSFYMDNSLRICEHKVKKMYTTNFVFKFKNMCTKKYIQI